MSFEFARDPKEEQTSALTRSKQGSQSLATVLDPPVDLRRGRQAANDVDAMLELTHELRSLSFPPSLLRRLPPSSLAPSSDCSRGTHYWKLERLLRCDQALSSFQGVHVSCEEDGRCELQAKLKVSSER